METTLDPRLEKLIIELFEINALKFGNFKMKVGVNSPVYFDLRVIVSFPKLLDLLANLIIELMNKENTGSFRHICGVPYAALPIATLVSVKSNTPMLIRRREAKDYGTKKMIEGHYNEGDQCIIIDDVMTTGSSIIDTVRDLNQVGLNVSNAVVVVDREQGGRQNLKERGIKMHVLTTLSQVLKILFKAEKITSQIISDVESYIAKTQINIDGSFHDETKNSNDAIKERLCTPFEKRSKLTQNETAQKIFELMVKKKSLLCVAADLRTSSDLLNLARQVGPYICIFKTHFDIIDDFTEVTKEELIKLANKHNFFIMEDRKFADIPKTVSMQSSPINKWADLVTVHSLPGELILEGLKTGQNKKNVGCFLVAELSSQGSLIDKKYSQETAKMAEKHSDIVVGLVCQSPDIVAAPHLIQLTPGVRIDVKNDEMGQNYSDPEHAVLQKGADVVVVGRGIVASDDPEKMASLYRDKLWTAYQIRISKY